MTTVVLERVQIEMTAEQFIVAYRQLPPAEQRKVRQELTHEEWEKQFRELLERIWARLEAHPISDEEIDEEVRIVREQRRARQFAVESGH